MRAAWIVLSTLALMACSLPPSPAGEASPATPATPADASMPPRPQTAPGNAAAGNIHVNADAVWRGEVSTCRTGAQAVGPCLLEAMRQDGASIDALDVATRLVALGDPGHISDWQVIHGIGHAQVTYPFRANTNEGLWLVDATGRAVDVDADMLPPGAMRLRRALIPFLDRHPEAMPVAPARAMGSQALPDGGLRLRFDVPMRACRACADLGTLELGYDFDAGRRYEGRSVIALREVEQAPDP